MKYVTLLFALFVVVALASAEDFKEEYCKEVINDPNSCIGQTCNKDNTEVKAVACAVAKCGKGKKEKVVQDLSKPYPQCCPQITCE